MGVIDFWGYLAVAGLVVIAPGADTMVVVRSALRGGLGDAARTAAGVCSGLTVWAVLSAAGLSAVLTTAPTAFAVIKVVGALYLVYLGVRAIMAARAGAPGPGEATSGGTWRSGALTSLGNPKVGVFYTSFLPQFIPVQDNPLAVSLALAGVHIALSLIVLLGYAVVVVLLGDVFRRRRWRQVIEGVTGTALCALGGGLIAATFIES